MATLHIVCGLPAVGKTTFARQLAAETRAVLLDSDTVTDLMIQASHRAAGLDPHDRDSPLYKQTYREPVYETLFAIAEENIVHSDVILVGPFTQEIIDLTRWKELLGKRFYGVQIEIHHLILPESERLARMRFRGAERDRAKWGDEAQ